MQHKAVPATCLIVETLETETAGGTPPIPLSITHLLGKYTRTPPKTNRTAARSTLQLIDRKFSAKPTGLFPHAHCIARVAPVMRLAKGYYSNAHPRQ